jgi:hypothetical protein
MPVTPPCEQAQHRRVPSRGPWVSLQRSTGRPEKTVVYQRARLVPMAVAQGHREGDHDGVVVLATRDDPLHTGGDVGYRLVIDSVSKPFG